MGRRHFLASAWLGCCLFAAPLSVAAGGVQAPGWTMQVPMPPSRTALLTAHGRKTYQDIELPAWNRVGHDVLFEKAISGQLTEAKILYADTSKFELVHRPDLFPPEEIVAKWELTPASAVPSPNRHPASPKIEQ